jgi:2-dehydro-3-deoxygluconokinase
MTESKTLNIICAGECLVELRKAPGNGTQYTSGFAGDVTNFAVYLKRLSASASVQFLSATGDDELSDSMRAFLSDESIGSDLLARSPDKTVGLYMIHTDRLGERTFSYWRSDSAARKMFEFADATQLSESVDQAGYFYFSGITLAILDPSGIQRLFGLAEQFRRQGKTVIFDPNYRPGLWSGREQALLQIERAYQMCNILLSSSEDEQLLWGESRTSDTLQRLSGYSIDEIVLTDGPGTISACDHGRQVQVQSVKAGKVVDTTSAGDSFNAGYVAARHAGYSVKESVAKASALASVVIGLPGAIIPRSEMPSPY